MYPWQPYQPWQYQASPYPPAPPQQAAVGSFYGHWAQVTTGNYPYNFPQPQPQHHVLCAICHTRINRGEPQCHFPPWNSNDGVESVGGNGNGTDGSVLPAVTLHLHCGKSRALCGPNLHLVSESTIVTRYRKGFPAYRNPTDAVKAAIRRSRRCLLEFNGFETPTWYHLEGELVPLIEEEVAKWRTRTKGKKKDAAVKGGGVAAAPSEKRQKEEKKAKIDDEAVAVLAAIAEAEEEECHAKEDDGGATSPHGGKEQSKPPPSKKAKHHGEQSKSPSSAAAAVKARKRKQTSFLWEEQAKEWEKPKNSHRATGIRRLHEKISELNDKYVCTKNTLDRLKRRNDELQARMETGMVAIPRSQRESLISYAKAAIDSDRGGEVRTAIEKFRDEEVGFMNVSIEEVIGSICDNGVVEEVEGNSAGMQDVGKGGSTNGDEGNTKDDAHTDERNRGEEVAKEEAYLGEEEDKANEEEEAKEDRKAREDMHRSESTEKEEIDLIITEPDECKKERKIFI